jgi:putative two-component system response regulator
MESVLPGLPARPLVLVVEDNPQLTTILRRVLSSAYSVETAADGFEGYKKARELRPSLILSDLMMPGRSGLELLQDIRGDRDLERTPFILLTARSGGDDRVQGLWSGANDYVTKPFSPQELLARVDNLVRLGSVERFLSDTNRALHGRADTLEGRLHRLFQNTVRTLAATIDAKDFYTGGHSERVAYFSLILAEPFNLAPEQMQTLELGALLHDIGKIGVPDRVLNKPAELSPDEVAIIREHPFNGGRILERVPELSEVRLMALHHHERWDGRGYPYGLKGNEIPFMARIVGMADCWDAMVSDRVYRPGMDPEIALAKCKKMGGSQLDPQVVDALCQVYKRLTPPEYLRPLKPGAPPTLNHPPVVGVPR